MAETAVGLQVAHMTLAEWLDDLTVRFLLNLPAAELSSVPRLCFQVEEAQWFYEDFIRPGNTSLPSLNLRQFLLTLFSHCPLLSGFDATQHVAAYEEFLSYKVRVPVRGAILMDDSMERVLLVRGWKKGASWSFPRGKINKDEKDLDCAIREVYEETGYDVAAAGLVEPNLQQDGEVKAIDITMREQHMKLFIIRGVPLDTYFEPRTRKEIGKIQWYNVKDLPGFKKHKGGIGQGHGEAAASKFYMVAPFLGHLKKWIALQRRAGHAGLQVRESQDLSASNTPQPGLTEDEGEVVQELSTNNDLDTGRQSADELKRLLSINATSPPATAPSQAQATAMDHTNNLLAMLKGSYSSAARDGLPYTPMEQIDPVLPARQPDPPRPRHPRHPSNGYQDQQSASHALHSSQGWLQSGGNFPHASPNPIAPHVGYFGQQQHSPFIPVQPQAQQYSQQRMLPVQSPDRNFSGQASYQGNAAASSINLYHQLHTTDPGRIQGPARQGQVDRHFGMSSAGAALASPMPTSEPHTAPSVWQTGHGAQQPLGGEQSAPEASKLPAPKLNAHALKLLDAFRDSGSSKPSAPQSTTVNAIKPAEGQQKATLLGLFKQAPGGQTSTTSLPTEAIAGPEPASPTLTDVTVKAPPHHFTDHALTSDEATRISQGAARVDLHVDPVPPTTLPQVQQSPQSKPSLPSRAAEDAQQRKDASRVLQDPTSQLDMAKRPRSRGQLYDPSSPKPNGHTLQRSGKVEDSLLKHSVTNAQRTLSRPAPRSPSVMPHAKSQNAGNESATAAPHFSILQRPGSSAGGTSRSPTPQSPPQQAMVQSGFQPQVLKRLTPLGSESQGGDEQEDDRLALADAKRGRLLSLFGKSPAMSKSTARPSMLKTTPVNEAKHMYSHNTTPEPPHSATAQPSIIKLPEPPPSPKLLPERKPMRQGSQSNHSSQQVLLSLFNKPSATTVTSPGTPISPFSLSSPIVSGPPSNKLKFEASEQRSGIGSLGSVLSSGGASGQQSPSSATPTMEAKGFMLDYLNGVVKKEGYRSAKR